MLGYLLYADWKNTYYVHRNYDFRLIIRIYGDRIICC